MIALNGSANVNGSFGESGSCNLTLNPWCGAFGGRQIFEITYLLFVSIFGSIGNLLVIASIIYKKRLHKHGNIFIVNLAVADLIVTGIHIPTVLANVFEAGNALPMTPCMVIGYVVTITCVCSVCNLTFIAVNRYWAVVHSETYEKIFSKRNTYIMVVLIWLWSNLLVSPTLYGWSGLGYDYKMMQCAWDDTSSLAYNIILLGSAIFLPLCVITFCYVTLFRNVRERGTIIRRHTISAVSKLEKKQKIQRREINLLKTLATTVVLFVLCWVPYGVCIIATQGHTPPNVKKIVGWLGLSNSAINFVVYGVMNRVFRKGYKDFLTFLLRCRCCTRKIKSGTTIFPAFVVVASTPKINKKNSLFNTQSQISSQPTPIRKKTLAVDTKPLPNSPPSSVRYSMNNLSEDSVNN